MEIEKLYLKSISGDLDSLKALLEELTRYIPPGIDNMVFLVDKGDYSLYLSRDGMKSVMVARGEFLPFIESHVARMSIDRLKEEDLRAIAERLPEILREIRLNASKYLEILDEGSGEYEDIARFISIVDEVLHHSTS